MKTLILSVVLLGFVAVVPVYAGGGFEPSNQGAYNGASGSGTGAGSNTIGQSPTSSTSTSPDAQSLAAVGDRAPMAVAVVLIVLGGVIALLVRYYRNKKV